VGFEAICKGLIDEGVTAREKEDVLRLIGAEKNIDQGHGCARLAGAGGHDEERAALVGSEGFGDAANGLVLVRAVDDGVVNGRRFEGSRFWRRNFSRSRSAGVKNPATRRGLARPTSQNQMSWPLAMNPNGAKGCFLAISVT